MISLPGTSTFSLTMRSLYTIFSGPGTFTFFSTIFSTIFSGPGTFWYLVITRVGPGILTISFTTFMRSLPGTSTLTSLTRTFSPDEEEDESALPTTAPATNPNAILLKLFITNPNLPPVAADDVDGSEFELLVAPSLPRLYGLSSRLITPFLLL